MFCVCSGFLRWNKHQRDGCLLSILGSKHQCLLRACSKSLGRPKHQWVLGVCQDPWAVWAKLSINGCLVFAPDPWTEQNNEWVLCVLLRIPVSNKASVGAWCVLSISGPSKASVGGLCLLRISWSPLPNLNIYGCLVLGEDPWNACAEPKLSINACMVCAWILGPILASVGARRFLKTPWLKTQESIACLVLAQNLMSD